MAIPVKILARIKEHGVLIGYMAVDRNNRRLFINMSDLNQYNFANAYINRNNELIAKRGFTIKTLHKEDEAEIKARRTSTIGKPKLILTSTYGDLSIKQKKLLELFKTQSIIRFDKKSSNIKITMKDMACLTAVTGLEYALFERNDKYIVVQGSKYNIRLDKKLVAEVVNKKYTWVGHTHPGTNYFCTMPSDDDYSVLKVIGQKRSAIYNSAGDVHVFESE